MIGVILADTKQQANKAAKAVHVVYKDLTPILTIEVNNLYFHSKKRLRITCMLDINDTVIF